MSQTATKHAAKRTKREQQRKTKRQQAKTQTATSSRELTAVEKFQLKTNPATQKTLALGVRVVLLGLVVVVAWVSALMVASRVVPDMSMMIAGATGAFEMGSMEEMIVFWIMPSVFLAGLIFIVYFYCIRGLWRAAMRAGDRFRDTFVAQPADGAATSTSQRS